MDLTSQINDARRNVKIIKGLSGKCFLDCGANIGEVSIAASDHFQKVVAVEANPTTCAELARRTRHYSNIVRVHRAVAGKSGVNMFVSQPSFCSIGATVRDAPRRKDPDYYALVQSITLLRLSQMYSPDVIKLDIEGSEFEALPNFVCPACVKYMWVEFHRHPDRIPPIVHHFNKQGFRSTEFKVDTTWTLQTIHFDRRAQ